MDTQKVMELQRKIGVTADGNWGPKSQAAFDRLMPTPTYDAGKWGLVPELQAKAVAFLGACHRAGYELKITQGLRTAAQQQALYDQGRTKPGAIVTNAKPGQSYHETGKAFDVCFAGAVAYPSDDRPWKAIADIGKSLGLAPGYYFQSFQDKPHFQI